MLVLLTVNALQLYGDIREMLQSLRTEEVRRLVILRQQAPLLVLHYRRQLLKVSDKEKLHTAERRQRVAVLSQDIIHGVKEVTAYHGHLVYHKQVHGADKILLLLGHAEIFLVLRRTPAPLCIGIVRDARYEGLEVKLEERVHRLAVGVQRGNTCRREHYHTFRRQLAQTLEECRFARTCLACKKHARLRAGDILPGKVHLVIVLCHDIIYE